MTNKLVITADDYGICKIIDDGIDVAVSNQWITAVSALPNGSNEDFDRVKKLHLEKGDQVDIGCHLNITNGSPLTNLPSGFTRRKGDWKLFKWILGHDLSEMNTDALYKELKAQVRRFEDSEIPLKHFSDHFGILTMLESRICAVVIRVVQEYNARHNVNVPLRNPMLISVLQEDGCLEDSKLKRMGRLANFLRKLPTEENGFQLFKRNLRNRVKQVRTGGLSSSDYFIDNYYGINRKRKPKVIKCLMSHEYLSKNLPSGRDPVYEMVVHLGREPKDSDDLRFLKKFWKFRRKDLKKNRPNELKYLPVFHSVLQQSNAYELTRFSDL